MNYGLQTYTKNWVLFALLTVTRYLKQVHRYNHVGSIVLKQKTTVT